MSIAEDLRGSAPAQAIKDRVAAQAVAYRSSGIVPRLCAVLASDDQSAVSYAQSKQKIAAKLGIQMDLIDLGNTVSQTELEDVLVKLSRDSSVHGIVLEFPLSDGLDGDDALAHIAPQKDVDGLTPYNLGLVATGHENKAILAATPQACIELAEARCSLAGARVGLVGRGRTVGRPLLLMLINRHATVTVCHTRTPNLAEALSTCDLIFVAAGKPNLVTAQHVRSGQVVIDAGINVVGGRIVGDVDAESVRPVVAALSPVPGGVGPLTSALIFHNLMLALEMQVQTGNHD